MALARGTSRKMLGEDALYSASEIQSPKRMRAEQRADGGPKASKGSNELAENPEARAIVSETMASQAV